MKKILINATQKEELRIALINKKKLFDLNIKNTKYKQKKSNIYKGIISRIEPSLEAVFINYGSKKHGFLPIKEISKEYFLEKNNKTKKKLYKGQELIVQINKDERDNKGAFLTTFITLIGNDLILLPNNPKTNGISKRIEGKNRIKLKSIIKKLNLPKNMGIIIRTSGLGKSLETLNLDLSIKIKYWKYIKKKSNKNKAPFLIHQENNILMRIFRDYLYKDINEIIIDNYKIYKLSIKYIKKLNKKDFINKIKFYNKKIPLFSYFKIETQIESAFLKEVKLPSGGSIIIDITEALTSIDINSSKSNKFTNIETTALQTNLEAIEEIIIQLRLRDIGGLIVIDFIDMSLFQNQKIIENKLKKIIKNDKAKIKIGKISKFGLLEMSRQRLNKSLKEISYNICPRCKGSGNIRDNESLSLSILRIIEEKSFKNNIKEIHAIVPINIGIYLLNNKRNTLHLIEKKNKKIKIFILPNIKIKTPNYSIITIKKNKYYYNIYKNIKKSKKNKIINKINYINNKKNILIKKNKLNNIINKIKNLKNNKYIENITNFYKKNIHTYLCNFFNKIKQFSLFKNKINYIYKKKYKNNKKYFS